MHGLAPLALQYSVTVFFAFIDLQWFACIIQIRVLSTLWQAMFEVRGRVEFGGLATTTSAGKQCHPLDAPKGGKPFVPNGKYMSSMFEPQSSRGQSVEGGSACW